MRSELPWTWRSLKIEMERSFLLAFISSSADAYWRLSFCRKKRTRPVMFAFDMICEKFAPNIYFHCSHSTVNWMSTVNILPSKSRNYPLHSPNVNTMQFFNGVTELFDFRMSRIELSKALRQKHRCNTRVSALTSTFQKWVWNFIIWMGPNAGEFLF